MMTSLDDSQWGDSTW